MRTSILRDVRSPRPSRNIRAVSANWLSTTTTASGLMSQPIVPPRAVKMPTLPRTAVNSGVADGCARSGTLYSADPTTPNVEVTMNSRRFHFMSGPLSRRERSYSGRFSTTPLQMTESSWAYADARRRLSHDVPHNVGKALAASPSPRVAAHAAHDTPSRTVAMYDRQRRRGPWRWRARPSPTGC